MNRKGAIAGTQLNNDKTRSNNSIERIERPWLKCSKPTLSHGVTIGNRQPHPAISAANPKHAPWSFSLLMIGGVQPNEVRSQINHESSHILRYKTWIRQPPQYLSYQVSGTHTTKRTANV